MEALCPRQQDSAIQCSIELVHPANVAVSIDSLLLSHTLWRPQIGLRARAVRDATSEMRRNQQLNWA